MTWFQNNRQQIHAFSVGDYNNEDNRIFYNDPYTLTLKGVDNLATDNRSGDITSILEVIADDVDNGTVVTCGIFQNSYNLIIYK